MAIGLFILQPFDELRIQYERGARGIICWVGVRSPFDKLRPGPECYGFRSSRRVPRAPTTVFRIIRFLFLLTRTN